MAAEIDAFHAHLDVCSQCERNPFDLCPRGRRLVRAATDAAGVTLGALPSDSTAGATEPPRLDSSDTDPNGYGGDPT